MSLRTVLALLALCFAAACGSSSHDPSSRSGPRQRIIVEHYNLSPDSGDACEIDGLLTNPGPGALEQFTLIATFHQGDRHMGVAQRRIEEPIGRGESLRFVMIYDCSRRGDRVVFSAETADDEIEVITRRQLRGPAQK
ncbi:MAG TPA: hypothetical protein VGX37_09150 [Allosphingosinicella sp.]|jgi:hypothetical protein|nr:hypothetical protein [Allosphingosinicella sp.]